MIMASCSKVVFVLAHLVLFDDVLMTKDVHHVCIFKHANCTCGNLHHQMLVDCSHRDLQHVPEFYANVSWIDLSNNDIENIEGGFPKNSHHIDLSRNKIRTLYNMPFRGLRKLRTLSLEGNRIHLTLFYNGLFEDLYSLRTLNLKGNSPPKEGVIIRDRVFSELQSLEILQMDGPSNITFGKAFGSLRKLQALDLSGITGNCSFKRIYQGMFTNIPGLKYLDVSACNVKDIDEGAFGNLPFLEKLDVSHNKQLGFASLPNITHNLNKSAIKILHINGINCWTGTGTKIRRHHLMNIKNTSLTEIYIEKNRLEQFEPGALLNVPKTLTKLSLGENKLTQGMYIIDYFFLERLRILNISVQLRPAPGPYPKSIFEDCEEKTDACGVGSRLHSVVEEDDERTKDKTVIKDRMIHNLKFPNDTLITIYVPRSLEIFYANVSRLYTPIPEFGINSTNLREIYGQSNFFYSWIGPIHGMQHISVLDLSDNLCSYISETFLKYATGLKVLNLSNNDIGQSLSKDEEGKIFENVISVENIDLSRDNIVSLPSLMFKNMRRLQIINLTNNLLSAWNVKIDHMRNITFISLAQNRLTTIEKEIRLTLLDSFQNSNLTMDLSGNKFLCSCENIDFLSWITQYRRNFKKFQSYKCSSASPNAFAFSNAESSLLYLRETCKSYLDVYIVTSVSIAFVSSTLIGVVLLKNKWKIRYFIFKVKQRFRKVRGYSNEFHSSSLYYKYHAMLSYSRSELTFILQEFIPRIEDDSNIKMYIRDRDEPAGVEKGQAIMDAIQDSRRVICLISKKYLKSKWRGYELNMARMEAIETRENMKFVHLVLFPEVYNGHLPKYLLDLVRDKSVTEFPDEECAYDDFWETLKSLILKELQSEY